MCENEILKDNPCEQLNDLVTILDSPVLVVAGPGTGKTTAIACRLRSLIEEKSVPPSRILAITFTNEATNEMKRKLEKLGVKQIPENIRTLHSFAMWVLRRNSSKIGVSSGFVVANSDESELVAKEVFSDLKNKGYQMPSRGAKKFMRAFQEKISCGLPASGTFLNGIEADDSNFSQFEHRYKRLLRFYNAVDWFEVVPLTNSLLSDDDIKDQVQQQFDHIVVDEYQDLNLSEQAFVRLIRGPNTTLFVVGDDDQSIYESGRFANPLGIKHFRREYSNAIIDKTTLTTSHRCPETILKAAVSLIEHNNPDRIQKQLYAIRKDGIVDKEGEYGSKQKEAKWIVLAIQEVHRQGITYNRILILFNIGAIGKDYIERVEKAGIPVDNQLRKLDALDCVEKRRLYFLLRLLLNKDDGLALRQLLVLEPGISDLAVSKIRDYAEVCSLTLSSALQQVVVAGKRQDNFKRWMQRFKRIYGWIEKVLLIRHPLPLHERFEQVINLLGYADLKFVKDFISLAEKSIGLEDWQILEKFREGKIPEVTSLEEDKKTNDKVRFMTMHNAKGLDDVDIVFIPALEDSIIPDNFLEQEQRRMLYVAMTRAREAVFLSNAWSRKGYERHRAGRSGVIGRKPSRFWDEIEIPKTKA